MLHCCHTNQQKCCIHRRNWWWKRRDTTEKYNKEIDGRIIHLDYDNKKPCHGGRGGRGGQVVSTTTRESGPQGQGGAGQVEEVCENSCSKNFYSAHFLITCWCRWSQSAALSGSSKNQLSTLRKTIEKIINTVPCILSLCHDYYTYLSRFQQFKCLCCLVTSLSLPFVESVVSM